MGYGVGSLVGLGVGGEVGSFVGIGVGEVHVPNVVEREDAKLPPAATIELPKVTS